MSGPGCERYAPAFTIHCMRSARNVPSRSSASSPLEPRRAAVVVADESLGARADPFHRPAERLRGEHQRAVFGVGVGAHAEPAADVARVEADLLDRVAEDRAQAAEHQRHALARCVEIERAGRGVVGGDRGLRLHRTAGEALRLQRHARDVRGLRERRLDLGLVAVLEVEREVARDPVVELRRARGERVVDLDQRRQIAILDLDPLGRVLRGGGRVGHDERHFLPDVANAADGERVAVRLERASCRPCPG